MVAVVFLVPVSCKTRRLGMATKLCRGAWEAVCGVRCLVSCCSRGSSRDRDTRTARYKGTETLLLVTEQRCEIRRYIGGRADAWYLHPTYPTAVSRRGDVDSDFGAARGWGRGRKVCSKGTERRAPIEQCRHLVACSLTNSHRGTSRTRANEPSSPTALVAAPHKTPRNAWYDVTDESTVIERICDDRALLEPQPPR